MTSEHVLLPTGSESQDLGDSPPAEPSSSNSSSVSRDSDNLESPTLLQTSPQKSNGNDGMPISVPHPRSPSLVSQFPVELSLLLVSQAFRAAATVVALRSLSLTSSRHIFWLHRHLILDPLAKVRVYHLLINLPTLEGDLIRQEPEWDGDFIYESDDEDYASSESSNEASESEMAELAEDLAFFMSEEGQKRSGLIRDDEGNVIEGVVRSPMEIGLQRAEGFISSSVSAIIWATAPVLGILKLQSMASPYVFFPQCPALVELDINTPFLIHSDEESPVFPALKRLCIRGRNHRQFIDVDKIIFHAPVLTHLRIPFTEDFLHALISALGLFPASATPLSKPARRFEHIERIILAYHHMDRTATISMKAESAIWSDTYTWGREELSSWNPPQSW
ncbi:hypothetical protein BD779DRAFT_1558203 [Infundibulicybe gibba]|nr:hypothetical protein BD779DRAFT_1558203 [Infundibulicybe gibba]